jgi:serine/threonine-protein kinase
MRVCPGCRTVYDEQVITCPKDGLPLIDRSPTFAALDEEATPPPAEKEEDTAVRPGLMIGEYQVESVIAEGGMGVIYAGIHPLIRKRVAIKVLNKRFAQDPKAVARFVLEARSVNEIGHHNIVDIFSIGELDDQRNYLIMEYLDGLAMHEILLKVKRMRPEEVVPIYEQLCDALKLAHAKEFVHRDLKPDNVIVLRRPPFPFIKILDFGLAKLRGSVTSTNTEVGTVLGTPEYMAPEQCRGDVVDARTDIYALGVMLYELITGCRPFTDKSPFRVLAMQQREMPKPPSRHVDLPEALEWVILRAMAKHPNQRFQSVDELMDNLNRSVTARAQWTINLDPIEKSEPEPAPPDPEEMVIPTALPPQPLGRAGNLPQIPLPVSISDEMSDDEMETMVADSRPGTEQPEEILKLLRKDEVAQEIRGDADSQEIALPSVRNVRLAPAAARAPEPLLGTPESGELEDGESTEVSDPPDLDSMQDTDVGAGLAALSEIPHASEATKPAAEQQEPPKPAETPAAKNEAPQPAAAKPAAAAAKPAAAGKPEAPKPPPPVPKRQIQRPSVPPEPATATDGTPDSEQKKQQRRSGAVPALDAEGKPRAPQQQQEQQPLQQRRSGEVLALVDEALQQIAAEQKAPDTTPKKTDAASPSATQRRSGPLPTVGRDGKPDLKAPIAKQRTEPLANRVPAVRKLADALPLFDDSGPQPAVESVQPTQPKGVKPPGAPPPTPVSKPAPAKPTDDLGEPVLPAPGDKTDVDVDIVKLKDEDGPAPRPESGELLVDVPPAELRGMQKQAAQGEPPQEKVEQQGKVEKVQSGVYSIGEADQSPLVGQPGKPPEHARTIRDIDPAFAKPQEEAEPESKPGPSLELEEASNAQPEVKAHWSTTTGSGSLVASSARKTALRTMTLVLVVLGAAVLGLVLVVVLYFVS